MKVKVILMSLALVMFADPAMGQSNDDIFKKRFLSEYPAAPEAWEMRVSKVEGMVRFTGDIAPVPPKVKKPHRVSVYSFKRKLPDMAWASETLDRDGLSRQRVRAITRNCRFH